MNEIKRIVVEHYPVEKLPEDLRAGLSGAQTVRVTVEPEIEREVAEAVTSKKPRPFRELMGCAAGMYPSADEGTRFIRQLRDEWDE